MHHQHEHIPFSLDFTHSKRDSWETLGAVAKICIFGILRVNHEIDFYAQKWETRVKLNSTTTIAYKRMCLVVNKKRMHWRRFHRIDTQLCWTSFFQGKILVLSLGNWFIKSNLSAIQRDAIFSPLNCFLQLTFPMFIKKFFMK